MNPALKLTTLACLLLAATNAPRAASAQPTQPTTQPTPFTLTPAAAPDPALKYTLLPQTTERLPGTAAPLYLNALAMQPGLNVTYHGKKQDLLDLADDLSLQPLADLKDPELASFLDRPALFDFLTQASLRQRAGWTSTIPQQGFAALLPALNSFRGVAGLLAARARWQLASGDLPGSLRTTRLLFSLSHHLDEDAVLVQGLVSASITNLALNRVLDDLVQQPAAPNLYYALADLPRPLFDVRAAMSWEKLAFRASLTPLRNGRSPDSLSPADWTQLLHDLQSMAGYVRNPGDRSANDPITAAAYALVYYPRAKQQLLAAGLPPEKVDAMPVPQAIGTATLATYDHYIDLQTSLANLPFHQAAPLAAALDHSLVRAKENDPTNLAYVALPSVARAYLTAALLDRHVAALQTIEALRAYAATHSDKLPTSLDQLTDTPAPPDPTTGRPFAYHPTSDTTATLSSPSPPGASHPTPLNYTITLRSK